QHGHWWRIRSTLLSPTEASALHRNEPCFSGLLKSVCRGSLYSFLNSPPVSLLGLGLIGSRRWGPWKAQSSALSVCPTDNKYSHTDADVGASRGAQAAVSPRRIA